jgi:hypothetical protein
MRRVLSTYQARGVKRRRTGLSRLVGDLVEVIESPHLLDVDELVDSWLATIRPRWRAALRAETGRRRRSALRRLDGLTSDLEKDPLSEDELRALRNSIKLAAPLGERVVAAIVGLPA